METTSNTVQEKGPSVKVRCTGKSANRKPWSSSEKEAVKRQLGKYFAVEKLPGKNEIETAIKKEPVLRNRPWAQIKFFIKNTKCSMSRKAVKSMFSM